MSSQKRSEEEEEEEEEEERKIGYNLSVKLAYVTCLHIRMQNYSEINLNFGFIVAKSGTFSQTY
jgi:hypothetical protein